jgi:hypothetical protein
MSQNDFTLANQSFPAFRADLNSALQALATNSSGGSAPSTTFANMWWYDTSNNIMYIRNEDNDAWIKFAELDQANDKFVLSGTLQLDDGTVSAPALTFNSDTNMGIYRGGTDILKFVTAGTDAVTIDASQNVGIATSSPDDTLHVNGNVFIEGSSPEITFETTGASNNNWQIACQENVANALEISVGSADADASNDTFSPVAVFTSSGNLLVGTTNTNPSGGNVEGTVIQSDGMLRISREGTSIEANIKGSDGSILVLKKDASTVGSIGTTSGVLTIDGNGANTGGFYFNGANNILPRKNKAFNSGTIDLGSTSQRWKDIYLSGGVYLGGTGSANYLDDYEIGTFQVTVSTQTSGTITVNSTFDTLSYTKIGRMVSISGIFGISSVSSPVGTFFLINGFPFNTGDLSELGGRASAHISFADTSASTVTSVGTLMLESTNQLRVYVNCASVGAGDDFYVNFSYFTS